MSEDNENQQQPQAGPRAEDPVKNKNNRYRERENRDGGNSSFRSFKGQIEVLPALGTKAEKMDQNTGTFIKKLANHILVNFKEPGVLSRAVATLEDPHLLLRGELPDKTNIITEMGITQFEAIDEETADEREERLRRNRLLAEPAEALYMQEMGLFAKKRSLLKANMAKLWGIIIGQCTKALVESVRAEHDWEEEQVGYNAIWLLKAIKRIVQGVTTSSNEYHTAFCATRDFYRTKQFDKSVEDYYTDFENALELVQQANADILDFTDLLAKERIKDENVTEEAVRQKFIAMAFILNADAKRYGTLWDDLHNNLLKGQDNYPTDMQSAVHMLTHWKVTKPRSNRNIRNNQSNRAAGRNGMQFLQNKNVPVQGRTGPLRPDITCFRCNRPGHYANDCPDENGAGGNIILSQLGFVFVQSQPKLPPTLIIIDTGSTFSSFFNRRLMKGVNVCGTIRGHTNGGFMDYNEKGDIELLPAIQAYHNSDSLANIISMSDLTRYYRVFKDSNYSSSFLYLSPMTVYWSSRNLVMDYMVLT